MVVVLVVVLVVVVVAVVILMVVVMVLVIQLTCVPVVGFDERGYVEALLKQRAHRPELWRHLPTGLQLAAARGTMALTFPPHMIHHHLPANSVVVQPHSSMDVFIRLTGIQEIS